MAQSGAGRDGRPAGRGAVAPRLGVARAARSSSKRSSRPAGSRAVVATSSLELGIDMGAGRPGGPGRSRRHRWPPGCSASVGPATRWARCPRACSSRSTAATSSSARSSRSGCGSAPIEAMRVPTQPARRARPADRRDGGHGPVDGRRLARRSSAGPRRSPALPDSALDAVLDMLAGRYPSDEFAELRPRLVWDRVTGHAHAAGQARSGWRSPAAARSPTAGLFGVFAGAPTAAGRRVGELDEEMVYESRVGDVFPLGTTSWRIEDITHDRVLVTPAPGQLGADAVLEGRRAWAGRSSWAGRSGAFAPARWRRGRRTPPGTGARPPAWTSGRPTTCSPTWPSSEPPPATCRTTEPFVVERFRDELGDWRLVVHSPVRRTGQRAVGAGDRGAACASGTASTRRSHARPTTGSSCGCRTLDAQSRRAPTSSCFDAGRDRGRW